jgi:hypothetical protein
MSGAGTNVHTKVRQFMVFSKARMMLQLLRYSWISRCVGILLLAAAALKLQGFRVDAVPSLGILSNPEIKVGLIEFEIFLGLWLLSGKARIGSWLTTIVAFGIFAVASAYQGWIGQASCGCFGRLSQLGKSLACSRAGSHHSCAAGRGPAGLDCATRQPTASST